MPEEEKKEKKARNDGEGIKKATGLINVLLQLAGDITPR